MSRGFRRASRLQEDGLCHAADEGLLVAGRRLRGVDHGLGRHVLQDDEGRYLADEALRDAHFRCAVLRSDGYRSNEVPERERVLMP